MRFSFLFTSCILGSMAGLALGDDCSCGGQPPQFPLDPPSRDTSGFYQAPSGVNLASLPIGTITKYRVNNAMASTITNYPPCSGNVNVYQLQFRTSDSNGTPTIGITTVLIPSNANYSRVASWHDAYDSCFTDCAPSYQLQFANPGNSDNSIIEGLVVKYMLSQGWIVVVPDYEGPTGAFTAGIISGQITLDSIRATLKISTQNSGVPVNPNADVAFIGYSGGSIATEWASELQSAYTSSAGRLPLGNIVGYAAGGLAADISYTYAATDGTDQAYLLPNSIIGLATQNSTWSSFVSQHQIFNQNDFNFAKGNCADQQHYKGDVINQPGRFFDLQLNTTQVFRDTIRALGTMGLHGFPIAPSYYFQGQTDEITPIVPVDALVKKYCSNGRSVIDYYRGPSQMHAGEAIFGISGAFQFLMDRFAHVPFITACRTTNSTSGPTPQVTFKIPNCAGSSNYN